jgi:drug/metabolite transporter (DMT)-like permease
LPLCIVWLASSGGAEAVAHLADAAAGLLSDPLSQPSLVGALLWTGVVTTALACVAETAALGALSSADATVIFSLEPLGACLFAYLMLAESLDASCVLGGALMLSACLVSGSEASVNAPRWLARARVKARRVRRRAELSTWRV